MNLTQHACSGCETRQVTADWSDGKNHYCRDCRSRAYRLAMAFWAELGETMPRIEGPGVATRA